MEVQSFPRINILQKKILPTPFTQSTSNQKKMKKTRKKENGGVLDELDDVVCYIHRSFHIQLVCDDARVRGYNPKDVEMFEKLSFCDAEHLQLNSCAICCA